MARWTPIPVAGGAYSDDARPWSVQDTVNYVPVKAEREGTRSASILRCLPGCTTFSVTGSNAPVRGLHNAEGKLLAVSGTSIYRIGTDGVATSLGTIPGTARCSIAHNQVSGGNEVAIANGSAGYIYNTGTGTLAQITDDGFPGAKIFDFLDGYLLYIEPQGRFWGWSDLAAGTSYNTLDRAESEAQPDRIVTGIVTHREWFVLGERSGEFYRNTGAETGTFQRIDGTEMEVGCAGTHAIAKVDNAVVWLGHDGIVYRLEGYQPRRISTFALEQAISRLDMAQAFATVYEDRGHKVVYFTFPDGKTWGYDVASGEWHRRQSDGLDRWRMSALCRWNNAWIAGDYSNGRLYQLDWAVQTEAGVEMERRRIFGVLHDNQNKLTVNALELVFGTGLGVDSVPLPTPLLSPLRISGDLPDGYIGEVVSYQYTASAGVRPYVSYVISAGTLPAGLAMNSAGLVTGTRTTAGTATWTVTVTDSDANQASIADSSLTGSNVYIASFTVSGAYKAVPGTITPAWGTAVTAPHFGFVYKDVSGIWLSTQGNSGTSVSTDGGASFTSIPISGVAGDGGRMAFAGGYQFVCGGVSTMYRRSTGAWSNPSDSSVSRANSIVVQNNKLVIASIYSGYVSISADYGATWAYAANQFHTAGFSGPNLLASNGTRLVILYNDGSGSYVCRIKYSDDGGNTWSASMFAFASPASNNYPAVMVYTGSGWVATTSTGQIATSPDAMTWTLSASTFAGVNSQIAVGGGKLLAACETLMYTSVNNGVTWQSATVPAGSSTVSGVAWLYS